MAIKDGYGLCKVHWFIDDKGAKRWKCLSALTSYPYPEKNTKCWHNPNCPGRSHLGYPLTPEEKKVKDEEFLSKTIKEAVKVCDNYECKHLVAEGRKRYCSDKCRKQKARIDYEARNPNRKR